MEIRLDDLTKKFEGNAKKNIPETIAVNNLKITIKDGELMGLLGPSGCGKSTTLYMLAGLKDPTSGEIWFDDEDVTHLAAEKRGIGLVFQNYALYPHMTVYKNIAFPLTNLKVLENKKNFIVEEGNKIIEVLKDPAKLIETIKGSAISGVIKKNSSVFAICEKYHISQYVAKKLYSFNLHVEKNPVKKANSLISKYEQIIGKERAKEANRGFGITDEGLIIKDGNLVKVVRKLSKDEIDSMIREVARLVQIEDFWKESLLNYPVVNNSVSPSLVPWSRSLEFYFWMSL